MSEIWTIITLIFSATEGLSAVEQLSRDNQFRSTIYFTDYDKCDSELRKLFGQFDYSGYKSQLFYATDNRLVLNVNQGNKVYKFLCIKITNFN